MSIANTDHFPDYGKYTNPGAIKVKNELVE